MGVTRDFQAVILVAMAVVFLAVKAVATRTTAREAIVEASETRDAAEVERKAIADKAASLDMKLKAARHEMMRAELPGWTEARELKPYAEKARSFMQQAAVARAQEKPLAVRVEALDFELARLRRMAKMSGYAMGLFAALAVGAVLLLAGRQWASDGPIADPDVDDDGPWT